MAADGSPAAKAVHAWGLTALVLAALAAVVFFVPPPAWLGCQIAKSGAAANGDLARDARFIVTFTAPGRGYGCVSADGELQAIWLDGRPWVLPSAYSYRVQRPRRVSRIRRKRPTPVRRRLSETRVIARLFAPLGVS